RIPLIAPETLVRWIAHLRAARAKRLASRSTAATLRSLNRVVERFLDPRSRQRREAIEALARTGTFSAPMLAHALDDAFQPLAHGGLSRWLAAELGSAQALDRPMPGPGGTRRQAHGPEWMLQIYAGNVPTVPVLPLVSALLMKSALLAKTAAQEPLFAPLLARAIAEVDPDLGDCMAVVWWKGGQSELDREALTRAPAVLVFGGETSTSSVAHAANPTASVVIQGPKVSVGYIGAGAMRGGALRSLAARAAHDVALYDQQGCLSPHAYFVERGGMVAPVAFAEALGSALEEASRRLPRREPVPADAASIQLSRAQAALEAATGRVARVIESERGTEWTVVFENDADARFEPGPRHRVVRVHAIADVEDFSRAVSGGERYLEAIAVEERGARRDRLVARIAALGVPRITSVGALQRPTPLGTHGGVTRLGPFLRWTTIDAGGAPRARAAAPKKSAPKKKATPKTKFPAKRKPRASASRPSGRGSRKGGGRSRR
ncbi:MAG TPA: acyl-CoA reductase, partial [Candidatus Eisenbacteria bacterium]|nr:acyl-CoA reductase [Candidatus Eisenbacteria bacterium]